MDKPKSFRLYTGMSEVDRGAIHEWVYFNWDKMTEEEKDEYAQEARDHGCIPPKKDVQ